jgi:pimeloyl-ACP methyl ester carboxylesterase
MTIPYVRLPTLPRPRARHVAQATTVLALAGVIYGVAAGVSRLAREAKRYRAASDVLYRRWTRIPAIVGPGMLRIHSRLRDVMTNQPPIVLVHGRGIASAWFVPLAARLSKDAPVFAPDLPGHGRSDPDARDLTVPELAQALGHWMEAMGLRGAVVVGHGIGCQVAVNAVAARPELASQVVLVAPGGNVQEGVVLPRHLACPVTFVRGARDRFVQRHWAERLALASGGAEPVTVAGSSRTMHHEDPDALAAIIVGLGASGERGRQREPA